MKIQIHGKDVDLRLPDVSKQDALYAKDSLIMSEWIASLDPRFKLIDITLQVVDFKGERSAQSVLFIRFKVTVFENGHFNSKVVELRGKTIAILPILICDGKVYTVLVNQPRISTGNYELPEAPAGMLDDGKFKGKAIEEIEEELDMKFKEDDLIDLSSNILGDNPDIYLSPGLLDESCRFFAVTKVVTQEDLQKIQGKLTGLREQQEFITLSVIPLEEITKRTRDAKAFIAYLLYKMWKGKVST
jgi:ADP-sugar diphosphatase